MTHTGRRLRHKHLGVSGLPNWNWKWGDRNWVLTRCTWGTRMMTSPRSEWDQRESQEGEQPFARVGLKTGRSFCSLTYCVCGMCGNLSPCYSHQCQKNCCCTLFIQLSHTVTLLSVCVCVSHVRERESCVYSGEGYTTLNSCFITAAECHFSRLLVQASRSSTSLKQCFFV